MNFDPLMIADNSDKLAWYREAEIKHARLAMLAAFVSGALALELLPRTSCRTQSVLHTYWT